MQEQPGTASAIIDEITAYEREYQSWEKRGDEIVKRYRDEVNIASTNAEVINRTFNILWANTEVLAPTLYSRLPKVEVQRRYKDKDPVGRAAALIAERAGSYILETTSSNEVLKCNVQDLLLPGRACAWVKYEAVTEDQPVVDPMSGQPAMDEDGKPATQPVKVSEKCEPIYIYWKDFGHSPRRTWAEVPRVWRRSYMSRAELVKRFGEKLGQELPLDREPVDKENGIDEMKSQATIYEVWCKDSGKVKWVHKSQPQILEEIDPPIDLEGFWPCPRPLWSVMTNNTLVPVPLFALYQDQAAELDKITNRIGRLTDALKIVGVYDSSVPELQRLLQPNGVPNNALVPVENWAGLSEKGGMKGAVDFVPIDMIATVLLQSYEARERVKQTIYEITGLSDIIRGATDPGETLGAQQLKSQYGSIRIRNLQNEVARFSRDIARIVVEIVVEMYEPATIYAMIGGQGFMPEQEFIAGMELLRNDKLRSFHVDIETDSTIALDEQQDKQSAQEFVTVMGGLLNQAGPLVAQAPELAPLIGETMMFLVRRFRAGRTLESTIEQAMDAIVQKVSQPQEPQPDPKLLIEQEKTKQEQLKLQFQAGEKDKDRQLEMMRFGQEIEVKRGGLQNDTRRVDLEEQKIYGDFNLRAQEGQRAEAIEDKRQNYDREKTTASMIRERERDTMAQQPKPVERDETSEAVGLGLQAVAEALKAVAKPKSVRVEQGPAGKRFVQEMME
jgi:hypothetical protein